ncbi:MAG TPA: amidohydrolase family protein [Gammaproteobacteria bacterium]|nr:amidohydrolase family protein [Gammaproteobacteria bacterium]
MKRTMFWLALLACACSAQESDTTVYTDARVIVGDGRVIENATFTVAGGRFTSVGATGELRVPADAASVDLTGMTVMPAIIDTHVHMSTTRDALIEDLRRRAEQGIGAAMSLGSDGADAPLGLRQEAIPGIARYRTAGRGITAPEPGRSEVPHWVTTVNEARQAVRDEAARNVDIIKIWVDDRNGQYEKLEPELYTAVIDEAHSNALKVTAHLFSLEDAKGLLRAGVDAFAHGVRDRDVDDEFVELVLERPEVMLVPNLPSRGAPTNLDWLEGSLPADELAELRANNVERFQVQPAFGIQARNLARLSDAGMRIAFGTDGNTFWAPHVELEDMVAAGMSPAEVIVAATANSAELMGLDDAGTIEAGKRADFIVLEANPLDDITNTRRIVDAYLEGEIVP